MIQLLLTMDVITEGDAVRVIYPIATIEVLPPLGAEIVVGSHQLNHNPIHYKVAGMVCDLRIPLEPKYILRTDVAYGLQCLVEAGVLYKGSDLYEQLSGKLTAEEFARIPT